jgi:endonuclease/exonuclease/phosphatase family metal-dependent hydrolase
VRILTWNLFHGRAVPPAGCDLRDEFATALAGWEWDVALLQEVPPWWPEPLARACGAQASSVLTSRNALLPLRRALAERRPDLMKSNGGGANAILVRPPLAIEGERRVPLRWWPERRMAHGVRLADGTWIVNLHAQVHSERRARSDLARALAAWTDAASLILGGDLNVRDPRVPLTSLGAHGVDHVLARRWTPAAPARPLDRATLSDHAPLLTEGSRADGRPERA